MKNIIQAVICSSLILFLFNFSYGQRSLSKKAPAHNCGEFHQPPQPIEDCPCNTTTVYNENGEPETTANYQWFDRFGNKYCNLSMDTNCGNGAATSKTPGGLVPDCTSPNGMFNLFFTSTINSPAPLSIDEQNLVCQVFADLEVLLVRANPLAEPANIEVQTMLSNTAAATATPYFESLGEINGIKHDEVWKAINTDFNDGDLWDGLLRINQNTNFTSTYSPGPLGGSAERDLYTAVLHEVVHLLGFYSLVDQGGSAYGEFLAPFATFITEDGTAIIQQTATYDWELSPGTTLTAGCDITIFEGSQGNSPVFAPTPYNGSSTNHLDIDCASGAGTDYVMHSSMLAAGSNAPRRLTQTEADILCDIGYELTGNYGTPQVVYGIAGFPMGSNNPNATTFTACGNILGATDDFDMHLTLNETYEACTGNTYSFDEQELIGNDIIPNGMNVSVVDVEEIAPNLGTAVATNLMGGFDFSPVGPGEYVFRYKLQNDNDPDEESNYAYVTFFVTPCPGFNCVNTDPCNLICNPNMENGGSCGTCSVAGMPIGCLDGWQAYVGSPDYAITCIGADHPGNTGGAVFLNGHGASRNLGFHNEAIMTSVNLVENQRYLLSFEARDWDRPNSITGLDVGLFFFDAVAGLPVPVFQPNYPTPSQFVANYPETSFNDSWRQFATCIIPDENYDILFFQAFRDAPGSSERLLLDGVELIADRMGDVPDTYQVACGSTRAIGLDLCEVNNMHFEWWDVTNGAFQLTSGDQIINMPTNYTVSILNANGSEIEISGMVANINLELRRVFDNAVNVALNCNQVAPVAIVAQSGTCFTGSIDNEGFINGDNCFSSLPVTAIPDGGQAPYTYNWTGASTWLLSSTSIASPTLANPGTNGPITFTCEITDANGNIAIANTTIIFNCETITTPTENCNQIPEAADIDLAFKVRNDFPGHLNLINNSTYFGNAVTGSPYCFGGACYDVEYQWYVNNETASTVVVFTTENFEIDFAEGGIYNICLRITLTNTNTNVDCQVILCEEDITIVGASNKTAQRIASNKQTSNIDDLLVFPNPTHEDITVRLAQNAIKEVRITDLAGRLIFNINTESVGEYRLPMHQLNAGVYIVTVTDEYSNSYNEKIIKLQ